jgi:hypothetical protein
MTPLWTMRRQQLQLCQRIESDERERRIKQGELRLLQYEISIVERLLETEGVNGFWEMELMITRNQEELARQELLRLETRLGRNRELLCVVDRDLESRYH